jgi:hypothetical protein
MRRSKTAHSITGSARIFDKERGSRSDAAREESLLSHFHLGGDASFTVKI